MSFFSRNDVPLKFRRGELKQPKKKIKRIFVEIEDLKTAYTMLDVRDKALFTTLLQTGLSEIDVCALNIEDILKQLDNPPAYIEGYREKTTIRYQTCVGADACVAIKKYLVLRGEPKKGALFATKFDERITPRSLREALKPVEKIIPHFKPKMLRDFYHDALERAK